MNDVRSLSHTKYNCKYLIVFIFRYRGKFSQRKKTRYKNNIKRIMQVELCLIVSC